MIKIKKLKIKGLRGVKNELTLDLSNQSALIYGDNGAGKSTIADAIEWYYTDKVDHLKGEEIGRSGLEALRHLDLPKEEPANVSLMMTDASAASEKALAIQGAQLKASYSNDSPKFQEYLAQSGNENLILRYRDLTKFILATKTERLETLLAIIGYKDITGTLGVLKAAYNAAQRGIKSRNFPRILGEHDQEIIEQYGQNITSDEQFLEATNSILKDAEFDETVSSLSDVNSVLRKIGRPDNTTVKKEEFLNRVTTQLASATATLHEINEQYSEFFERFSAIVSDATKFRKLLLDKVLSSASDLLGNEAYTADECPVCLSERNIVQLKADVDKRIEELSEIQAEQKNLSDSKTDIIQSVSVFESAMIALLNDDQSKEDWFTETGIRIRDLVAEVKKYDSAVKLKPAIDAEPVKKTDLIISTETTDGLYNSTKEQRDKVQESLNADTGMEVYNKISIADRSYASIRKLIDERAKLESQRDTLEVFYQEFSETQKIALQSFLDTFSDRIQAVYQFMNPDVAVENIKLVPLEKNDEMVGMTFHMDFLDYKDISPPHKYLSESHLNCIGIAFFLASAEAFNKQNKFLIMDDVISSFDENHRKRFGDLLVEKYSNYQLLILTHERAWFELLTNQVRGRGWVVDAVMYSGKNGTEIKPPPEQIRESIEAKIDEQDTESLASLARKYLEGRLKDIARNLEVRVVFRFNDKNEDRMTAELLSDLKAHLNRKKCTELKNEAAIRRLQSSIFIGNKATHDSGFVPSFADAKAFWDDICKFESLFRCSSCGIYVSTKYIDNVEGRIRCKDGELTYSWTK